MKVVLIYVSPNKTTQRVSGELAKHFLNDGHEVIELNIGKRETWNYEKIDFSTFKNADLLGIGSPVYHLTILEPMREFLRFALPRIYGQNHTIKAFAYVTYAGITSGKALINTAKLLRNNKIELTGALKIKAPHFWHLDNYPDDHAVSIIEDFYINLKDKKFNPISWSKAEALFSRQKPLIKLIYPLTKVIGKHRMQPIEILKEKCVKCKKCVNECPVNAFEMNEYPERKKEKCITCYHCTTVCPKHAIECNVEKIKEIVASNKKVVGLEQPQDEIFI